MASISHLVVCDRGGRPSRYDRKTRVTVHRGPLLQRRRAEHRPSKSQWEKTFGGLLLARGSMFVKKTVWSIVVEPARTRNSKLQDSRLNPLLWSDQSMLASMILSASSLGRVNMTSWLPSISSSLNSPRRDDILG